MYENEQMRLEYIQELKRRFEEEKRQLEAELVPAHARAHALRCGGAAGLRCISAGRAGARRRCGALKRRARAGADARGAPRRARETRGG